MMDKIEFIDQTIHDAQQSHAATRAPSVERPQAGREFDSPMEFSVDVDGKVFNVKISRRWAGISETRAVKPREPAKKEERPEEMSAGAVPCGMAGLLLFFQVKVGDAVASGDPVAVVEAMKMRAQLTSPHGGVVRKICVGEGEMVGPDDILMVVA
jgi:biotin carboxyl carrier protein